MYEQGAQWKFGLNLNAKYGEGTSNELQMLAQTTVKITRGEYEENIRYYKTLVNNLKKELDKWFSLYIRLRHAQYGGVNQCFTCGKVDNYKKLK